MYLAQEDAARIELMAAQLGHQAAACFVVEPPAHQLFDAVVLLMAGTGVAGLLGAWAGATIAPLATSTIDGTGALILSAAGWFVLFGRDDRSRIISEIRVVGDHLRRSMLGVRNLGWRRGGRTIRLRQ